jgi:hypothetical protein
MLRNITEESRFVTFQFPAHDNNNIADARIYEETGTVVTIQDPERMSGKIYSNKYTIFSRKFFFA